MPPPAVFAVALAPLVLASTAAMGTGAGEQAAFEDAPGGDLGFRTCPEAGPVDFGVGPVQTRCTNGPVAVGGVVSHGFSFPPPGFSGRLTSTLRGDLGDVRVFSCSSAYAANLPVTGLVSPYIYCTGSGPFPFHQMVTQDCVADGTPALGLWACYLGA